MPLFIKRMRPRGGFLRSPTDQGELAMQRGLGRGFQGADAGSAHSPLAFPHERLHQDAMK